MSDHTYGVEAVFKGARKWETIDAGLTEKQALQLLKRCVSDHERGTFGSYRKLRLFRKTRTEIKVLVLK
jgi:hypothetical protein